MAFLISAMVLVVAQSSGLSQIFDDASAREVIQLRRQFDEAELAAIREFDAVVGASRMKVAIPVDHYRNQAAGPEMSAIHYTAEQKRRAAQAWPIRQRKVDQAEARLIERTILVLKRIGFSSHDLPPIRRRKWDGPAVMAFNGPGSDGRPESRALLRELIRLWNLSARERL